MSKIVLPNVVNADRLTTINDNFQKVEDALNNNVLYRDNLPGEPNSMSDDLDMNSRRIYNLPTPALDHEAARLVDVQNAVTGAKTANLVTVTPVGTISSTNVQAALQELDGDVQAHISDTSAAHSSSAIDFIAAGTGATTRTMQDKGRESVSVFDYMTAAEITAVQAYTFALDVTTAVQKAMDAAWSLKVDLFAPGGGYLVTSLTLPGTYPTLDERARSFRMYGQGYGNPFSTLNNGGTIFKSVTDAPVLTDRAVSGSASHGSFEIDHIRFDGTSLTPVVLLDSSYGTSSFHNNVIYQRGDGDGWRLNYGATIHVYENYSINSDFATFGLGAARTGVGFNFVNTAEAGLVTFRKNTSRGWHDGYKIDGTAATIYSPKISDSECSLVYNGISLINTNRATVVDNYFEGGDGGIGIIDQGEYTSINDNIIFSGFAKGVDVSSTTSSGSVVSGNTVSTGALVGGIGIDVYSDGNTKTVTSNVLVSTANTAGAIGVKITGLTGPKVFVAGNTFSPSNAWTGVGAFRVSNSSTNGVFGLVQAEVEPRDIPFLSRGAVSLFTAPTALTASNVSAGVLTLPYKASSFIVTAAGAVAVTSLALDTAGMLVVLRTTNANMTFTDSATLVLAGSVAFTGPGLLTLFVEKSGATVTAYEVSRTVF